MKEEIIIQKGFEGHFHPRDEEMMRNVLPYTARQFAGGVCMGNLPGDNVIDTLEKRLAWIGDMNTIAPNFNPIVPLMVTRKLLKTKGAVLTAIEKGVRVFKFIPGGLTNNGADGLTLYDFYTPEFFSFFRYLEACGAIFSCHFEVGIDRIYKRKIAPRNQEVEAIQFLKYLLEVFPRLRIVVEHASTKEMIDFIDCLPNQYKVAASLAPQHALISYADVMDHDDNFIDSKLYCKPIAKNTYDLIAVKLAMCSGRPWFFAGTDSAPHLLETKLRKIDPSPGIFNAPVAKQCYADIFDNLGRLDYLNNFTSVFGPQFYGLEPSNEKITLIKKPELIPEVISGIPVFLGGSKTEWSIVD